MAEGDLLELSLTVPPELVEPVAEVFRRFAGPVALEEPGGWNPDAGEPPPSGPVTVRTYLPAGPRGARKRARLETALALLSLITPLPPLQERRLAPEAWQSAWREGFQALRVGRRLLIVPPWQEPPARPGDAVVIIEPGLAFGTGHHPTTRLCLEALEERLRPGDRVLDLGTGSGILAVGALRLGAGFVLALDTDPQAVRSARANLRRNRLARRARVARGTLPHPLAPPASFDLALANISAPVLTRLAPHLAEVLKPGGLAVLSGFLEEQAGEVARAYAGLGMAQEAVRRSEGWQALLLRRGPARG